MANTVRSLVRANRIVEELIDLEIASVSTLAEELDIPLSTVYDYVGTLDSIGYLTRLPDGRYRVSCRFLSLGNSVRDQYHLYITAKSELQKLAVETGEYAVLMVEEDGLAVILSLHQGEKASYTTINQTYAGTRTRLSTTANGKAILSKLSDERVQSIIDEYGLSTKTENAIIDPDELFDEIEDVRETGYAIDDEERFEGMRGISVPIISKPDEVIASIGLYGPTTRFTDTVLEEDLLQKLFEVENVIRVNLTYS